MHTILVTGATGTVGSATIKALEESDIIVRAGVHSIIKGERLKHPQVELVEIDFSRPETIEAAMTGVEKLFLITPFSETQVEMARCLIDQAKKCGIKHIVRLSAMGADAEPGIQLGRWHREVEKMIEESGIPYTHLRPASFMQNFANFYSGNIQNDDHIFLPLGQGKISYIDARDIADVAKKVLLTDQFYNQAITLTGPQALSVADIAHQISHVAGRQIHYQEITDEEAKEAMLNHQVPKNLADAMNELHALGKAGYCSGITSGVQEITGRKPRDFHQFAHDYKSCFSKKEENVTP
ncbi:MAG: SDR family oxidoreductase [Sphingobacteriales bacterium]|nr:MAG: SDR family oxidoreductase [Sphingobacteriales bacterium]